MMEGRKRNKEPIRGEGEKKMMTKIDNNNRKQL